MDTPETKVKKKIKKYLDSLSETSDKLIYYECREAGGFCYKKGLPDMWATINGKHLEIEIKKEEGGRRSTMQIKWEEIFNSLGVAYCCVSSVQELDEAIKKLESN
jgi:hypothetical protein